MLTNKTKLINTNTLFILSLIGMISIYLNILGYYKTISIILDEILILIALVPILLILRHYKKKLQGYEIIDFTQNSSISLKSTIGFFLVFQVVDFYYEGGFIGMISQWFLYWSLGIITIFLMQLINYYKNYKLYLQHGMID